jgi:two-component system nitrogen regulation sensor histidine kinase NtrY
MTDFRSIAGSFDLGATARRLGLRLRVLGRRLSSIMGPLPAANARSGSFWAGVIVALSVISGLATFLILTNLTPLAPRNDVVLGVLFINGVLIAAMLAIVTLQLRTLVTAWRQKVPGARLHVRIVLLFSIIAAIPAILIAAAASTTFSRSLDTWFSTRTRSIVQSSLAVAQAYVEEHGQVIRTEIVSMARDLDSASPALLRDPKSLRGLLVVQAGLRNIQAAFLIDREGVATTSAILDDKISFTPPPPEVIQRALAGQPVLMHSPSTSRIGAVTRLQSRPDTMLYVVRSISQEVLGYIASARLSVDEYERLRQNRTGLTAAHGLMYLTISMTALLAAVWCGMWFAGRFVAPIQRLILAARQVSAGNLDIALPEKRGEGDLRRLSQTFNKMTADLKTQRDDLVQANTELTERRAFIEAVLTGVSAGVVGVDPEGRVTLVNRSAERLLKRSARDLIGKPIVEALPEAAAPLALQGSRMSQGGSPDQIVIDVAGEERTFAVRVTDHEAEAGSSADPGAAPTAEAAGQGRGVVITLDDITELVMAQRTSAWADVARRIAHEIKNPLTPIQLSAERLKRKYAGSIATDRETFEKLTDTISRQVDNLKHIVNEFAAFARLPEAHMTVSDLREAVEGPAVLFQESHPAVTFRIAIPEQPVILSADSKQIGQAVTNLVKNAVEATDARASEADRPADYAPMIDVALKTEGGMVVIEVIDNGVGLPKNRSRIIEPYVTTKAKGTGIGLSIVRKIVEQHGGVLSLEDAPVVPGRPRGAMVRLVLPAERARQAPPPTGPPGARAAPAETRRDAAE